AGSCFPGCPSLTTATVRIKPRQLAGRFEPSTAQSGSRPRLAYSDVPANPDSAEATSLCTSTRAHLGGHTHEQAVQFIRAAAEKALGSELLPSSDDSAAPLDEEAACGPSCPVLELESGRVAWISSDRLFRPPKPASEHEPATAAPENLGRLRNRYRAYQFRVPKLFGNAKNSDNDDIADTDRECGFAQREFMISKTADAETAGEGLKCSRDRLAGPRYASNLDEFPKFR
uniref:LSM14 domain-containing protein n=1 Tax=Macrostomum lignano TaxID=282301 RepID=A0A1I8F3W3_9PLAT